MRGTGKLTFFHPDYSISNYICISRLRLSDLFSQVCILVLDCSCFECPFWTFCRWTPRRAEIFTVSDLLTLLWRFAMRGLLYGKISYRIIAYLRMHICCAVFIRRFFDFTEFFLIRHVSVRSLCALGTCGYCRMDMIYRSFDRCAVRVGLTVWGDLSWKR